MQNASAGSHGTISVTLEPSGELRISARLPKRGTRRGASLQQQPQDAASCLLRRNQRICHHVAPLKPGFGGDTAETDFGSKARRAVKNAVGALKSMYGNRIVFATVTLAGSTQAARQALSRWSSKAVELLQKWLKYHAPNCHWVYVWERQKSGALHLHAAIGHADVLRLRALERGFQEYVHKLHSQLSKLSGLDLFARESGGSWRGFPQILRSNCVPVRKCVKRYMSKYITKGVGAVPGDSPARWWGCSRSLRAMVGALRRCTRLRTSNWERIVSLFQQIRMRAQTTKASLFHWTCPYAPHNQTLLLYMPEDKCDDAYSWVVLLLENWTVAEAAKVAN